MPFQSLTGITRVGIGCVCPSVTSYHCSVPPANKALVEVTSDIYIYNIYIYIYQYYVSLRVLPFLGSMVYLARVSCKGTAIYDTCAKVPHITYIIGATIWEARVWGGHSLRGCSLGSFTLGGYSLGRYCLVGYIWCHRIVM